MPNHNGIAYEVKGEGDWLLLINGIGAGKVAWDFLIEEFSRNFRCLIFDNRGVGDSHVPEGPYSTRQMADDAAALMTKLGVARAHVMGISMGGAIAQEFAINHPQLVDRLAIVCSWAACDRYLERCFVIMKEMALAEGMRGIGWSKPVQRFLSLIGFARNTFLDNVAMIDAAEAAGAAAVDAGSEQSYLGFVAQADACLSHDTRKRLGAIKAPTFVLAGDADAFTPLTLSEELAERIGGASFEIMEGCGHVMFLERTAEFNRRIIDFLKGRKQRR
jgi:pimeloyl-ACP methyl ester carboxylesterase